MSNQFTTDPIETLDDWNAVLTNGCCCLMPECPIVEMDCQNVDGSHDDVLMFPIAEPSDGEIVRLYKNSEVDAKTGVWLGTIGHYTVYGDPAIFQFEEIITGTFTNTLTAIIDTHDANSYDPSIPSCGPDTPLVYGDVHPEKLDIVSEPPDSVTCDEATYRGETSIVIYDSGTVKSLHGCPGPFKPGDGTDEYSWSNLRRHDLYNVDLSDPQTKISFRTAAADDLPDNFDDPDGSFCVAYYRITHDPSNFLDSRNGWPTKESVSDFKTWSGCDPNLDDVHVETSLRDVRYRWHIPEEWTGSYFKITWDVLTEPDGWDDTVNDPNPPDPLPEDWNWADHQVPKPGRPSRSYVQDLTVEWVGPGTAIPDPVLDEGGSITNQDAIDTATATWYTPWNDLNPPSEPGTRRVVNIRFECYRGPYGTKPQLTGEGVDLTEDTPLQKRFTSKRHGINIPLTF